MAQQQVVEDSHNAHQEQEEEDSFSEQVARGARKDVLRRILDECPYARQTRSLLCSFIPLRGLPHVAHKVLLPHYKIDDPRKGGRSFGQKGETH